MQLTLKFLNQPQPATPLDRLEPVQRVELVQTLARIITKAAGQAGLPMVSEIAPVKPTGETQND